MEKYTEEQIEQRLKGIAYEFGTEKKPIISINSDSCIAIVMDWILPILKSESPFYKGIMFLNNYSIPQIFKESNGSNPPYFHEHYVLEQIKSEKYKNFQKFHMFKNKIHLEDYKIIGVLSIPISTTKSSEVVFSPADRDIIYSDSKQEQIIEVLQFFKKKYCTEQP